MLSYHRVRESMQKSTHRQRISLYFIHKIELYNVLSLHTISHNKSKFWILIVSLHESHIGKLPITGVFLQSRRWPLNYV